MSLRIIGGAFKGRRIKAPKNQATRPALESLRESLFNICQMKVEGSFVLDLFAGSGSIGFEALSRGARSVVFVEKDRKAMKCIRENIDTLQVQDRAKTLFIDAFIAVEKLKSSFFDIICIDPPYDIITHEMKEGLLLQILNNDLLDNNGVVFFEERATSKADATQLVVEGFHRKSHRTFGSTHLSEYVRT